MKQNKIPFDKIGEFLTTCYLHSGGEFLAYHLQRLFLEIKDEGDKALHNETRNEIFTMIAGREDEFLKAIADIVLKIAQETNLLKDLKNE
ncbi:MAG: hypothetical protein PHG53_09505 [Phycisphaerae bacterium]|nr:hypothetical protein [Phycisphaerae bacterium]